MNWAAPTGPRLSGMRYWSEVLKIAASQASAPQSGGHLNTAPIRSMAAQPWSGQVALLRDDVLTKEGPWEPGLG